jgi:hypothetical protein
MQGWMRGRGSAATPVSERSGSPRKSSSVPAERTGGNDTIDRLLDKISEQGYEALTEDEKQILYKASRND